MENEEEVQNKPAPVTVANEDPILVDVKNDEPLRVRTEQDKVAASRVTSADKVAALAKVDSNIKQAETAADADKLRVEDQRRISGIWERTQQIIALLVVLATVGVSSFKAIYDALSDPDRSVAAGPAFLFLVAASNLVIGFYFGRTNHSRIGGSTTAKDDEGFR